VRSIRTWDAKLEDSVHGAQTDLKSVAICDEQVGVRFLYLPPTWGVQQDGSCTALEKRRLAYAGRGSIPPRPAKFSTRADRPNYTSIFQPLHVLDLPVKSLCRFP
jgi:hypothetical protein